MINSIRRVENDRIVILRKSYIDITGDIQSAYLLSYLEYWHNIKLEMVTRNKSANDTAEKHGDERYNDETLLQFHKTEEIQDECLGVFTRQGLKNAKDNLVNLGLISLHSNPNPRYKFDKTTFFLLHTGKLNEMLCKYEHTKSVISNEPNRSHRTDQIGNIEHTKSVTSNEPKQSYPLTETVTSIDRNGNTSLPKQLHPLTDTVTTIPMITTENTTKITTKTTTEKKEEWNSPEFLMDIWNDFVDFIKGEKKVSLSKCLKMTSTRRKKAILRLKEIGSESDLKLLFENIRKSNFLLGNNKNNWKVTFDWLIENDTNMVKILENKYNQEKNRGSAITWEDIEKIKEDSNFKSIETETKSIFDI